MVCMTLYYLSLFFLLAGADATIAPEFVSLAERAQQMAKYVDGWTLANERGFQATGKAMQTFNANDVSTARMQAHVAVEAFQRGLSFCSEAQDLANRLPEPASSGATHAIRSAQHEILKNLECAKQLSQNMQQGQKPVATCLEAWMTTSKKPTTTIAPASIPLAIQQMEKYIHAMKQANEKGHQAFRRAMQTVNANDFTTAGMQADMAVEAFQTGVSICSKAQDTANRLPEPASSAAADAVRTAQQEFSKNLECAKLLSQSMQQGQKPVATCFKAIMTSDRPAEEAQNMAKYDDGWGQATETGFSFVKFPIVMVAGMATLLALLAAGMYRWKKRNISFVYIETDKMLVVDEAMSSNRWAHKVHDWEPVGHQPLTHWANQHQPQLSPAGRSTTFVA